MIQPTSSGTVLIVDDEESIRSALSALLNQLGFDVLTATNGQEGLWVYRQQSDKIRAVMLDLGMPVMGGAQALEELKAFDPEALVIVCSAQSRMGLRAGAAGFLPKPFDKSTLTEVFDAYGLLESC